MFHNLVLACTMIGSLHAYTVSVTNIRLADSTAVPILLPDSAPVPIGGGSVAVGYFESLGAPDLVVGDYNLLLQDFVQFGGLDSEVSFNGVVETSGFLDRRITGSIPEGGNEFTNKDLFIFFGSGATLEDSESFALYDSGQVFGEENVLGIGAADIIIVDPAEGLVRGRNVGPVDLDLGVILSSAIEMEQVPEPGTSLLLLFSLGVPICWRRSRTR